MQKCSLKCFPPIKRPSFIVIQEIMRVTRWIVLPLLPKALYELGFFEGIVTSGKTIRQITRITDKETDESWDIYNMKN